MKIVGALKIARLELRKGDTLVAKTGQQHLTKEQCDHIRESVAHYVPEGVKILVLTGDMTLSVVTPANG